MVYISNQLWNILRAKVWSWHNFPIDLFGLIASLSLDILDYCLVVLVTISPEKFQRSKRSTKVLPTKFGFFWCYIVIIPHNCKIKCFSSYVLNWYKIIWNHVAALKQWILVFLSCSLQFFEQGVLDSIRRETKDIIWPCLLRETPIEPFIMHELTRF